MPSSLFPQQIVNRINPMSHPTPQLLNAMGVQNPIMPSQTQNNKDRVLQLWNLVKNSNNPQQMFDQLLSSNPDLKKAVDTINALGDPQKLFYTMAQQQGTDPNTVLNLLK